MPVIQDGALVQTDFELMVIGMICEEATVLAPNYGPWRARFEASGFLWLEGASSEPPIHFFRGDWLQAVREAHAWDRGKLEVLVDELKLFISQVDPNSNAQGRPSLMLRMFEEMETLLSQKDQDA